MSEDDRSPGWGAIDAALDSLYPGVEPRHWGTVVSWMLGGPDPLHGISAYRNEDHWHFVTYGFTDLWTDESPDQEESGYGFELTFRLAHHGSEEPPMWVLNFLQNLGRYVFKTGNVFSTGDKMNVNGPIALEEDTALTGIVFTVDPALPDPVNSPHGTFRFIQVVGITGDEHDLTLRWSSDGLLEILAQTNPMLVTDLRRPSILDDPARAAAIAERVAAEGSSQGASFMPSLRWECRGDTATVFIGALQVRSTTGVLQGRLPFARSLSLYGQDHVVRFEPGKRTEWRISDNTLVLTFDEPAGRRIVDSLAPRRGTHTWPQLPGLTFVVEPTELRSADGKTVLEVIG